MLFLGRYPVIVGKHCVFALFVVWRVIVRFGVTGTAGDGESKDIVHISMSSLLAPPKSKETIRPLRAL